MSEFDFSQFQFHQVLELAPDYEVYDFTQGYNAERMRNSVFGVGRYNERRKGMYTAELFTGDPDSIRDIHVGIDLAAPVGAPVTAFFSGKISAVKIHSAAGDYGGTVVTEHRFELSNQPPRTLWALHGHLSHASARMREVGSLIEAGDVIGRLGDKNENGGWNPHLHFQLSWREPIDCDLPGVVNSKDLDEALRLYPDPRLILGPLY